MIEIVRREQFVYLNDGGKQLARLDLAEAFAFKTTLESELCLMQDAARAILRDKIMRAENDIAALRASLAAIDAIESATAVVLANEPDDPAEVAEQASRFIDAKVHRLGAEEDAGAAAPKEKMPPARGKPEPQVIAAETLRCAALAVEIGRDIAVVTRGEAQVEVAPRVGRLFYLLGRAFGELVDSNFLAREIYSATNADALQRLSQLAGDATSFAPRLGLTIAYTRPIGWRMKEAKR